MQLTLLVLAVFIAFVASKCTNGESAIKTNSGLCTCQWYNDKGTCCPNIQGYGNPKEAGGAAFGLFPGACPKKTNTGPRFPCKGANSQCQELLKLGNCGVKCSPVQDSFYDKSKGFKLCKAFTKKIWNSCKDQPWFSKKDWECKKLKDKYDNVTHLIAESSLIDHITGKVYVGDDDKDCLNAASSTAPAALVSLAAIGAVAGVRNPLFLTLLLVALSSVLVSATCLDESKNDFKPVKVKAMGACAWYKDKSCCPSFGSISNPWTELGKIAKPSSYEVKSICKPMAAACLDAINFARCIKCSDKVKEIAYRICDARAKKIYDACKEEETFDSEKWKCKPIKDVYTNSSQLVASLGDGLRQDNGDDCWNASALEIFSVAVVALLGLALF